MQLNSFSFLFFFDLEKKAIGKHVRIRFELQLAWAL